MAHSNAGALTVAELDYSQRELQAVLANLIDRQAERAPDAIAFYVPGESPISYAALQGRIRQVVRVLRGAGVECNERVCVALPNGPEMAAMLVAVSACATIAPLSPASTAKECHAYFEHLKPSVVIVPDGESAAREVAQSLGIPVLTIAPGSDVLEDEASHLSASDVGAICIDFAQADDVALILFTSGTTARPKMVPLTHTNICASAREMARSLELAPGDRYLNLMPLTHIHGIMATLSALVTGGSVCVPRDPRAPNFARWTSEFHPTWFTAAPTFHQAILAQLHPPPATTSWHSLRFIRSCSSALLAKTRQQLEAVFGVPVLEAYGMTEAAAQISCNPVPPGKTRPGSVGLPTGPEVVILDERGQIQPPGAPGEIAVRGPSIISGYADDPIADASTFTDGWFRTGDRGYLDSDGYLFITDRIKDIIIRGGQNISPHEIEEVFLSHPAVADAVVFPVHHPTLGEELGAAVVLRPDSGASAQDIRQHSAALLSSPKVPRHIVTVERIPHGPTGKVQRRLLAAQLGIGHSSASTSMPVTALENELVRIWEELLGSDRVGTRDNFFDLGGDSLLAMVMFAEVHTRFGVSLPTSTLFSAATIENLAQMITQVGVEGSHSPLVPIQPYGTRTPLFCVHALDGDVVTFGALARHLGEDQPVYGLRVPTLDGNIRMTRYPDLAAAYVEAIRAVQPGGPYLLAGFSFGAGLAVEMARQFTAAGEKVAFVASFDGPPTHSPYKKLQWRPGYFARVLHQAVLSGNGLRRLTSSQRAAYTRQEALMLRNMVRNSMQRRLAGLIPGCFAAASNSAPEALDLEAVNFSPREREIAVGLSQLVAEYTPQTYSGRITLFRAEVQPIITTGDLKMEWGSLAEGGVDVVRVPGSHDTVLREPHVRILAAHLNARLRASVER